MSLFDLFFKAVRPKRSKKSNPFGYLRPKKAKSPEIERLRKIAKETLPTKIRELARLHGFEYNQLRIKNVKTRWGSCSFKNNINLNLHLVKLDDNLIEYVILHELCHTIEKNHGKRFWNLLEHHMPDCKKRRSELRKVKIRL